MAETFRRILLSVEAMELTVTAPLISIFCFLLGMTAVWMRFRNRPMLGSTSSGLMMSSSSCSHQRQAQITWWENYMQKKSTTYSLIIS
jgi:hypothetical protein